MQKIFCKFLFSKNFSAYPKGINMKSKLLSTLILIFTVSLLIFGFIKIDDINPYTDYAPGILEETNQNSNNPVDTTTPGNWPYTVKWNFNFSNVPGVNSGSVGAIKYSGFYYLNTWNSTTCYRYDDTGINGGPGNQGQLTYVGSIRDMTIANGYLWGGQAGNTLYKFNANMSTISTFPIPGAQIRAIAWDPNRGGFWSCNFSGAIQCNDSNGTLLASISNSLTGKYGLAWDSSLTPNTAMLWVWNQQSPNNGLYKFNAQTGILLETYIFPNSASAGGAEIMRIGNELDLLLNFQNTALVCYTLKSASPIFFDQFPNLVYWTVTNNGGTCVWQIFNPPYPNAYTLPPESSGGVLAADANHCGSGTTLLSTATVTNPINCTGYQNIYLDWDNDWRHIDAQDIARVQVSYNGGITWNTVIEWTGISKRTSHESYLLPGALNNSNVLIRFVSIQPGWYWWWVIDNVLISGDILTNATINGNEIPDDYSLSQNYPNPFNPVTTIEYSIPKSGLVALDVYNVLGKNIATLVNESQDAGNYQIEFKGNNLPSGTYFYRFQSGNFIQVRKMILLK